MDGIDLSLFVKTKADATDFVAKIGSILEHVYKTDFNIERELLMQFGLTKQEKFVAFLRNNNVQLDSLAQIQSFLTTLQQKVSHLPVLTLTLAFDPTEETLEKLADWFILNTKQHLLFDITVNTELIAGVTITYNGKYVDTSVRPAFDAILPTLWNTPKPLPLAATPAPQMTQVHPGQSPPVPQPVAAKPVGT